MRKIKFHPEARKEIQHETTFYRKAGQTTGNRFIKETKKASEQIQKNPEMWTSQSDRLRGIIINRFPFTMI
jgi:plasmid stabilization system protein ParE